MIGEKAVGIIEGRRAVLGTCYVKECDE